MADTQHGRSDPYENKKQETDIKTHSLIMILSRCDLYSLILHYTTARIFIQNKIVQSAYKTDIQQPEKHMKPTINKLCL